MFYFTIHTLIDRRGSLEFSSMPTTFMSLPSELRNQIYQDVLLSENPIVVKAIYGIDMLDINPVLLLANRTIHREASSLLYAQNTFNLSECTQQDGVSFLETIGPENAGRIGRVIINFPGLKFDASLTPGVSAPDKRDVILIEKIKHSCHSLHTITIPAYSTRDTLSCYDTPEQQGAFVELLTQLNTLLKNIPSLQDIIVEAFEGSFFDDQIKIMESHGWILKFVEDDFETKGSFQGVVDDFYFFSSEEEYDYGGYDDYDIDYDSDFWRRAGD